MKDRFDCSTAPLKTKKLWLFDMDGTIYEENRLFDGTLDLLRLIRERGGRSVFITNNSSKSVTDYILKVKAMGIEATEEDFFTSAQATIRLLKQQYPGALVYCQGTRSLVAELRAAGIRVTEAVEDVDVVLVGFDMELTMEKLRNTCEILTRQDPVFLATNPDWVCPVSFGFVPDCGSMCVGIRYATGKWPKFIGKPEPTMIDIVREKFNASCEETIVIGDRLYTDIAAGVNAGVDTVCVLSGEAKLEEIMDGTVKPSWTLDSVRTIADILEAGPDEEEKPGFGGVAEGQG